MVDDYIMVYFFMVVVDEDVMYDGYCLGFKVCVLFVFVGISDNVDCCILV